MLNLFAGFPFDEPLAWIVTIAAAAVMLPYVVGPFVIKATHKSKAEPTLITFDPDERPAPLAVQEYLDEAEAALWGCGFEVLQHVALPDLVPNIKAIFVLLTRPESDDSAIAVAAFGEGSAASVRKFYVEFGTDFADGFEINTNNSSEESAYRPLPHKKILQFDFIQDPAELWRVHERAVAEFGTGPKQPSPTRHTAIDRLRNGMRKEFEDQVAVGWLWYDGPDEVYRPTWIGAFLMTWKLCWPISAYRRALRRRRARALLSQWDLTDVAQASA